MAESYWETILYISARVSHVFVKMAVLWHPLVMESNIETGDEELKSLEERVRDLQKQIQDLLG